MTMAHLASQKVGSPALVALNVSKSFGNATVLDSFELSIEAGEVHALVGENGSGKSTFIKILSGYHDPDPGAQIMIAGEHLRFGDIGAPYRLGARFVHQELGLIESESVLDNLSYGSGYPVRFGTIRGRSARSRAIGDLARVGLDVDPKRPVVSLALAERTTVAVARALRSERDAPVRFLVLDEPTATLPAGEVASLLRVVRRVAAEGVGVLYVTHHLEELFEVADRVTVLRDGKTVARRAIRDLDRAELVNLLVGREFDEAHHVAVELPPPDGETILEVEGISAGPLLDLSFSVQSGEVLGFAGITGSGREAVLPALFGATKRASGSVRVRNRLVPPGRPDESIAAGLAYLPPDRKALGAAMELSARENFSITGIPVFWRRFRLSRRSEATIARRWFSSLSVRPSGVLDAKLGSFSGGNQQKVLFAKWLWREPPVLLLDEPTQGVDVAAKSVLHRRLLDTARSGVAVLLASADIDELVALCTRIIVLRNGRISADLRAGGLTVSSVLTAMMGAESHAVDAKGPEDRR